MKEYKLAEEEALAVMVLAEKRDQVLAKFDAAMRKLEKSFGKEAGISDGNFQRRGPDIYIVQQEDTDEDS